MPTTVTAAKHARKVNAKPKTPAKPKSHGPKGPAYTKRVVCAKRGCKEVRWTKPQDAFQVKFCAEHQAEAAMAKRLTAAKARRAAANAAVAS